MSESHCIVLARLWLEEMKEQQSQCSAGEIWDKDWTDLQYMADFEILPVKMSYSLTEDIYRLLSFGYITDDDDGLLVMPVECMSVDMPSGNFSTDPFTFEISLFQRKGNRLFKALLTTDGGLYTDVATTTLRSRTKMMVKNPQIIYAETFEEVTGAVMMGYRLMEKDSARIVINTAEEDVILFLTDTFRIDSLAEMSAPFNHRSYRVSLKTGMRQIYQYEIFNGHYASLWEERDPKITWKFDPCWAKLELDPNVSSSHVNIELAKRVIEGREIRVLMTDLPEGSVVTDVIRVTKTPTEVIVHIAPYLIPFSVVGPGTSKYRISWTLDSSGAVGYCQHSVQDNKFVSGARMSSSFRIEWIYSTKPWKMVLCIDNKGHTISGDSLGLVNAATGGKTIRTCFHQTPEDRLVCFTATSAMVTSSGGYIIVQSPAASAWEDIQGRDCPKSAYLVSSEGWVKMAKFEGSYQVQESVAVFNITWFIN